MKVVGAFRILWGFMDYPETCLFGVFVWGAAIPRLSRNQPLEILSTQWYNIYAAAAVITDAVRNELCLFRVIRDNNALRLTVSVGLPNDNELLAHVSLFLKLSGFISREFPVMPT
jgi:hypothetical protein